MKAQEIGKLAAQHILKDITLDVPKPLKKREKLRFVGLRIMVALVACLFIIGMLVFVFFLDVYNNPTPSSLDPTVFIVTFIGVIIGTIGIGSRLCSKR